MKKQNMSMITITKSYEDWCTILWPYPTCGLQFTSMYWQDCVPDSYYNLCDVIGCLRSSSLCTEIVCDRVDGCRLFYASLKYGRPSGVLYINKLKMQSSHLLTLSEYCSMYFCCSSEKQCNRIQSTCR